MNSEVHTVLGGSGAMGKAVIKELQKRNLSVRAVTQCTKIPGVETVLTDLLDKLGAKVAIENSSVVYLCIGLRYRSKIWALHWPVMMANIIDACTHAHAKLIFFDNIYMYGPSPLSVPFAEDHLQLPVTKKGLARKNTADILLKAIAEQRIEATIARSADFYGELAINSTLYISFLQNILKGKDPMVLGRKDIGHTYAYCGDNAKAMVELAISPDTFGKVWHLPVGPMVTFYEINEIFNKALGTNFTVKSIHPFMRKILGLFVPTVAEVEEMLYQFQSPYHMNSERFLKRFPYFQVTEYTDGLQRMIASFKELA